MGEGVLAFITNHSYLDNATFRGMRQSLLNSFDEIFILDLHGNSVRKEKSPDGSKDENVFDIQQGVAIAFLIKQKLKKSRRNIQFYEIYGDRDKKYEWLMRKDINIIDWIKIRPSKEYYLLKIIDEKESDTYNKYSKIDEIFIVNNSGMYTARDHLTIKWTERELYNTLQTFIRLDVESARQSFKLGNDVQGWKVADAQKDVKSTKTDKNKIISYLYRPFDVRYTYYTGKSGGFHCRTRPEIMKNFFEQNISICVGRQGSVTGSDTYDIVFISENILDYNLFRRGGNRIFLLYLLPATDNKDLFSEKELVEKKPNIKPELFEELKTKYMKEITPEEIFYYIYAVLYSNTYRTKYAEFLKIDFPRIPFTSNYKLFIKLGKLGQQLADLHLLNADELNKPISKFSGKGDNKVTQRPKYENEKVYINGSQYFTNVK